jgi:hypothetical protein
LREFCARRASGALRILEANHARLIFVNRVRPRVPATA